MNLSPGNKGPSVEEAADAYVPALNVKVNGRRLLWDVLAKIWQCGQTIFYSSPVSVFYYFSFLFNLSCKHSYSFCVCGCVVHICTPVCHSVCVWMCLHVYIIISTRGYLDGLMHHNYIVWRPWPLITCPVRSRVWRCICGWNDRCVVAIISCGGCLVCSPMAVFTMKKPRVPVLSSA